MSCSTCRFWKAERHHFGLCRRRSPGITEQGGTKWPTTVGHDVCGDHEEHPAASVRELRVSKEQTDRDPLPLAESDLADRFARRTGLDRVVRQPAVLTQEVTLPSGWLSDAFARALGVRCTHPRDFEVQISVGGVPSCPDCNELQSGVRA